MHRSPTKVPHILTKNPPHPKNNIQRYIKSICIAHTLCKKKNNIENKIIELMGSLFVCIEIKGSVRDCEEEQGRSNAMCWGSGRPGHCCGQTSCGPAFWEAHPFDGGALALVQGPAQSQGWVELIPVLITVTAFVRAATTAQAINRRTSRVLAGRRVLGRWYPATVAPRCAAGAISRRRNRFGLDVQALSRGQGQIWTLT